MTPFRLLKIYRRAMTLAGLFEEAHVSKSLFASRTFWFNVLTAAAELTQVLPLPAGTLTLAATVINIALRAITNQPVHLVTPK